MKYTSIHLLLVFTNYLALNWDFTIATLLFNIFAYVITLVVFFIFIFFFPTGYINTIVDFKKFNNVLFAQLSLIFSILALAGTPPFLGFTTKLLAILVLFKSNQFFSLFLFFILNAFSVYFYITIIRFVVNTPLSGETVVKDYYLTLNINLIVYSIFLLIFICLNLFFYSELLNFFILFFS